MQDNQLKKNNKGVTLVEVIAVVAVLSVVMAAVAGFMITGARMSAQVSGTAKANSREFTAVEFINQRLWEAQNVDIPDSSDDLITVIKIDEIELKTAPGDDPQAPKVTYNGVVLCDGEISFVYDSTTSTVIYTLNGTPHVVHLRTEPTTD